MAKRLKRIGFVDYRLDNFHANVYLKLLRGDLKARGYTVNGCWALDGKAGRQWSEINQVPWCATPEELDGLVDHYVILAPSNQEKHLSLCRRFFPFGKSCYVDKTFAPDATQAKEIFKLADRHKVAMQTTSPLRYTEVQQAAAVDPKAVRHMVAWGGGRSFGEYAIHPVELVVSCMGPGIKRLRRRGSGRQSQLLLDFSGNRTAVVNVYVGADTPFAASLTTHAGTQIIKVDTGAIFRDTAAAFLSLFDSGRPAIDRRETMAVMCILDAAREKRALSGFISVG